MFWIRKATAAGVATLVLLAAGFAVGLSARQSPDAAAQDKEKAAVKQPAPPAKADGPYIVFTIRGIGRPDDRTAASLPFALAEYDAQEKVRWSVVPGWDVAEKWGGPVLPIEFKQDAIIGGARDYLTRVKKDATAPHDLRVVIENDAQVGGFTLAGLHACRAAGFDTIRLTGYVPNGGGFIPQLRIGKDGEADGYKRYRDERVDTKKLVADYAQLMRTF